MWDSLNSDPCGACQPRPTDMSICEDMEDPYSFKENAQPFLKADDLSMYDTITSPRQYTELSHPHCSHRNSNGPLRQRSVEYHDTNSRDSGYGQSLDRMSSYSSPTRLNSFESQSLCSMEDEFLDLSDVEPLEKPRLPKDFNKLIAGTIRQSPKNKENTPSPNDKIIRPLFRRALSLQNNYNDNTPNSSRVRTSLFRGDEDIKSFKRPDPPSILESSFECSDVKRSKMFEEEPEAAVPTFRPVLKRAFSSTDESIMCAVQRSDTEPDLIGDFSRQFGLPLTIGRHQDLKAITPKTLSKLITGEFGNTIDSFKVIDCRYPYEFEGGHINGAVNIYTKEQCLHLLERSQVPKEKFQRHILIFHCEFSSERGPNLYRYLRKEDRQRNQRHYPYLHYPEMYILEGGYKKFFEQFSEMCTPVAYKEMLHPDHENDLKHFRQKSKTWNCDSRHRQMGRSVKRLGL